MEKWRLILIMMCSYVYAQSQDLAADTLEERHTALKAKPYEIAYGVACLNVRDEMIFGNTGEPSLEVLNGLLLRYKFSSLSLRFNASFFENESARSTARNFKIGPGVQWTPGIRKELLYVFMDCNYKSRRESTTILEVTSSSVNNYAIHAKINGLDIAAGLGTKIRIFKSLYGSLEVAYNQYVAKNTKQTVQYLTQQSSDQASAHHYENLLVRFYLSLVF